MYIWYIYGVYTCITGIHRCTYLGGEIYDDPVAVQPPPRAPTLPLPLPLPLLRTGGCDLPSPLRRCHVRPGDTQLDPSLRLLPLLVHQIVPQVVPVAGGEPRACHGYTDGSLRSGRAWALGKVVDDMPEEVVLEGEGERERELVFDLNLGIPIGTHNA